jgi:hypothetical protein
MFKNLTEYFPTLIGATCKSNGTDLYPVNCDNNQTPSSNPITNTNPSNGGFDIFSIFTNNSSGITSSLNEYSYLSQVVYYIALFVLIWTIWYSVINIREFRYYSLTRRSLKNSLEFQGYEHFETAKRVLQTGFFIQIPLLVYTLISNDIGKFLYILLIILPAFIMKILFDVSHFRLVVESKNWKDNFKDYKFKGYGEQTGLYLKKMAGGLGGFFASTKPDTGDKKSDTKVAKDGKDSKDKVTKK